MLISGFIRALHALINSNPITNQGTKLESEKVLSQGCLRASRAISQGYLRASRPISQGCLRASRAFSQGYLSRYRK